MNLGKTIEGRIINLDFAEEIVKNNIQENGNKIKIFGGLTTSKIRSLLDMVNNIYTIVCNVTNEMLPQKVIEDIEYLKIKFVYEASRENSVKNFMEKTYVRKILNEIIIKKERKMFLDYCRYFEALVAYAKFYGMGDK